MAQGVDYAALAAGLEQMREGIRAMVAGLVVDGFTEEQARDIVAGLWRAAHRQDKDDD